jgi:hypothetical protein
MNMISLSGGMNLTQVYVTLSKEMLQALLANLIDLKFPASDFLVENEVDGINEITRIINLVSGDVFEQVVQKQDVEQAKGECKIYEFPPKLSHDLPGDPNKECELLKSEKNEQDKERGKDIHKDGKKEKTAKKGKEEKEER